MTKRQREGVGDINGSETDNKLYAEGEADVAAIQADDSDAPDEIERHVAAAGGGLRLWPTDKVYPLGNRLFGSIPNLKAALEYEDCCSSRCLTRVAAELDPNGICRIRDLSLFLVQVHSQGVL
jgi:hypothetical protein